MPGVTSIFPKISLINHFVMTKEELGAKKGVRKGCNVILCLIYFFFSKYKSVTSYTDVCFINVAA